MKIEHKHRKLIYININVPCGEWEKSPRLWAKTLVHYNKTSLSLRDIPPMRRENSIDIEVSPLKGGMVEDQGGYVVY